MAACVAWLVLGCGGPESSQAAPTSASRAAGGERQGDEAFQVAGLKGAIPPEVIDERLGEHKQRFVRCFYDGMAEQELLAGAIEFDFRVGSDGRVLSVHPSASDIGDRETERCLLEVARATRFPRPQGGDEAEFTWQFGFDGTDARPPVSWDEAHVRGVVAEHGSLLEACGGAGEYLVTVYVGPRGEVLGAGAAAESAEAAESLDCVVETVRAWPMPDPGSYPAKVTFRAP